MSRVRVLPEILSNKIAAGEVVERPASVVKEMVENSLDAGATRVIVEVEQGGRNLIRISDDGQGMGPDDALLSLERYATSKIAKDADLFAIHTLGFRGEAVPSIASVSKFEMVTRERENESGTRIVVDGGKVKDVSETGAAPGTVISVRSLFFNTPARRKFMKTVATEMGHIADTLSAIALGFPSVHFRLLHNGRTVKSLAGGDLRLRAVDILGREFKDRLFEVDHKTEAATVKGFVGAPDLSRSTTNRVYCYVNGRVIRDRIVHHALFDGYRERLMKGRYPVAVLYITLPAGEVDVNVHPTKHQVRFANEKAVQMTIRDAVADALTAEDRKKWEGKSGKVLQEERRQIVEQASRFVKKMEGLPGRELDETPDVPSTPSPDAGVEGAFVPDAVFRPESVAEPVVALETEGPSSLPEMPAELLDVPPLEEPEEKKRESLPEERPIFASSFYSDLRIVGQLKNTYILCESEAGLVIIDQHAAHERVRYEMLRRRHREGGGKSQQLLVPETLEFGFKEAAACERLIPELEKLGLEVAPFGGTTFVLKAVPDLLSAHDLVPVVTDMVEAAVHAGGEHVAEAIDDALILMACHGAIRANHALNDTEIRTLFRDLDTCTNPSRCPHGRPIWIQWEDRLLEKSFGRTG